MQIHLATQQLGDKIVRFFGKYLDVQNEAITGREFFCPLGVKAAIKRRQVIVCMDNKEVVAALRFYPRKRDGIVSVYQFAIAEAQRKHGLLDTMLQKTGYSKFEVLCPIGGVFNEYYKKTNWILEKTDEAYNYWGKTL